jgi:hypothetical protein
MDEDPSLNASLNLAASSCDPEGNCANLASISDLDNPHESRLIFTLSDFKLRKECSLTFNKPGTKERT